MNLRAVAVVAGTFLTGASACLSAAVIAASPAETPTLSDCRGQCPVITPAPLDRLTTHTDRVGPVPTLKP